MAQRTVLILNESVPLVQGPQAGDHYYLPRTVELGSGISQFINPGAGNVGIKIGPEASGGFGWRDITTDIIVKGAGVNDPSWAQIGSTVFYAYSFAVGDECWLAFHIPHDYVPGTDVYFHVHFTTDGTDVNDVKFQWEYVYADGFGNGNFGFASPTTINATQTPSGTAEDHYVVESAAQTISGMEVDGFVYARLTRITNGGTENTDGIFVITSDIHYQSHNLATKNKAPNFYS